MERRNAWKTYTQEQLKELELEVRPEEVTE